MKAGHDTRGIDDISAIIHVPQNNSRLMRVWHQVSLPNARPGVHMITRQICTYRHCASTALLRMRFVWCFRNVLAKNKARAFHTRDWLFVIPIHTEPKVGLLDHNDTKAHCAPLAKLWQVFGCLRNIIGF